MLLSFQALLRLFFHFLFFFSYFALKAQDSIPVQNEEKVEVRDYWKKDAFDDVLKDETLLPRDSLVQVDYSRIHKKYAAEFDYDEANVDGLSFQEKLQRRIKQFLELLFPKWGYQSGKLYQNLFIFLGISILVFVIYKLVFSGKRVLIIDKKEIQQEETLFIEKNLKRLDLKDYIERAIESGKFELAIRYLYLANLQALAKNDFIDWDYRKTNSEFLNEIQDKDLKQRFQETTSIFNFIWFGEFEINAEQFEHYKGVFLNFKNQISK